MAERDLAGKKVTWYGTLTFGLVSVPVGLTVAQQRKEFSFKQLHGGGCGRRLTQPKTCEEHGVVPVDQVVKGYEYEKGEYVVVNDDDLDELGPVASKGIVIERFVHVEDVDPIYFDRTYFLTAAKEPEGRTGYRLLLDAMRQTDKAAVARFVLWGKENLCLVRPSATDEVLVLDTLFYAEDVRDPVNIVKEVSNVAASDAELDMAKKLIESLSEDGYDPDAYPNEHRERVRSMLDDLVKGKPKPKKKAEPKPEPTPDLLAGLKASIEATKKPTKKASRSTAKTKSTPRGRAVAKKAQAARKR